MSKRKPATATKHSRSPKIAAKAQRAAQLLLEVRKSAVCARLGQARLNWPQSVLTTHNKRLSLLRIR